ncbi:MAG: NfeD family protein [Oscillospiraceae bacterium]
MSQAVIGWLIAIAVFIVAEAATVALVSVWFIGGAVCALVAAILGAGLGVQLAVFLVVSAALLAFACPAARKKWAKKPERMNADRLVGETAMVTEPIDACADTGAVKINGVLWTAKCTTGERVEAGGHVTIERVEGAKLYVRPAKCPCTKA